MSYPGTAKVRIGNGTTRTRIGPRYFLIGAIEASNLERFGLLSASLALIGSISEMSEKDVG